jgi:hypothetical protein
MHETGPKEWQAKIAGIPVTIAWVSYKLLMKLFVNSTTNS